MPSPERQIENLIYTYAERLDAGDFEAVGELLNNAEVSGENGSQLPAGKDGLALFYRSLILMGSDGTPNTHHVTSNVTINVEKGGLQANANSYFTVLQATDNFPLQPIIAGQYKDRFALIDKSWQFTHRRMSSRLNGNLGQHIDQSILQKIASK